MIIPRHRKPTHLLWTASAVAIAIGSAPYNAHAQNASPAAAQPVAKQDSAKPQKGSQKRLQRPDDKSLATPIGAPATFAFVTKAPAPALAPAWTGIYAGVTFGPTFMKAALTPVTQTVDVFTAPFRRPLFKLRPRPAIKSGTAAAAAGVL